MKRILCLALAALLLFGLCGFAGAESELPEIKTVQERVIEVTYDTYDFEKGIAYLGDRYDPYLQGGCSAMKVILDGKTYVGRNYDFYCGDAPAFIVRLNAGKYRTVAIGNSPASLPAWQENYTLSDAVLSALPLLCCDVMNEAGLYCETNIRVGEEGLTCSSTNPGQPRRCTQTFMQTMLSEYGTIDEILAHIDDYDWFDLQEMGNFCQAFLLVDKSGRSVCVEFAADSWAATESDWNFNFFIHEEYYAKENYPIGRGRRDRVLAAKESVKTPEDIFTMMATASYAQFFKADCDVDYAIEEWLDELGYTRFNLDEHREEARAKMREILRTYDNYTWEELVRDHCWETTFSNVVSLEDLSISVHFSEHYGISFTVSFS